jgi:hypothetical protein
MGEDTFCNTQEANCRPIWGRLQAEGCRAQHRGTAIGFLVTAATPCLAAALDSMQQSLPRVA